MVGEVSWGVGCQHGHIGRWSFSDYSPNNSEAFYNAFVARSQWKVISLPFSDCSPKIEVRHF